MQVIWMVCFQCLTSPPVPDGKETVSSQPADRNAALDILPNETFTEPRCLLCATGSFRGRPLAWPAGSYQGSRHSSCSPPACFARGGGLESQPKRCLLPPLRAGPGWSPALRLLARAGGDPTLPQESLPAPFPPSSSGNSPGPARQSSPGAFCPCSSLSSASASPRAAAARPWPRSALAPPPRAAKAF